MQSLKKISLLSFLILFLVAFGLAAETPLASRMLTQALTEEVSGEMAFRYADSISRFDRIQASEGYHEAALMIKKELEKMGYKDVALEGFPSDGSKRYYTYRSVIGWRAKKAELWLLSPRRERLCSYEEIPLTLIKHSNRADVEAELVDVGSGTGEESYQNKEVKGKIVLATGSSSEVMREAVFKRGAVGIVSWYSPETRPGYPNMIRYTAFWPRWEEREKMGFGFNVSKNQGWLLKKMLEERKKVILKADVDAEFYETKLEVLDASFVGTEEPEKELMLIAHLCHPTPSANDNASGSGGILEMARALKRMVDKGLLEPPRRTIRFVWVPEFNGTVPYIQAHLERIRNTLAVINCDMIGENLHSTGGLFNIFSTPDSMPSYLNDVVANFAKLADSLNLKSISGTDHPFAYRVLPFSGGSDHYLFNDGSLKVPAVMFNHGDIFHHTSLDTPDKMDSSELRRVSFIALGSIYYLANAGDREARQMSSLIARNGLGRLSADYYDSLSLMMVSDGPEKLHDSYKQVLNVIEHASQRETEAVLSSLRFTKEEDPEAEIRGFITSLKELASSFRAEAQRLYVSLYLKLGIKPKAISLTAEEKELSKIVPVRAENFVCPLEEDYLTEKLGEAILSRIKIRGYVAYEALNFADGRRSILDIAKAVSAEFSPVKAGDVHEFFKVLEEAELVKLKRI